MKTTFPEPITALPQADIPIPGIKALMSLGEGHQLLFMEYSENADITFFGQKDRYIIKNNS